MKSGFGVLRHIIENMKIGALVSVPLGVTLYVGRVLYGALVRDLGGLFFSSEITALIALLLYAYAVGMFLNKTSVLPYLKERYRTSTVALRILSFLPDHTRHRNGTKLKESEVWYYIAENVRIRGDVVSECVDTDGSTWWIIHFQSPPFPKTGMTLVEIRKNDPKLVFTGRRSMDNVSYIMSYGATANSRQ